MQYDFARSVGIRWKDGWRTGWHHKGNYADDVYGKAGADVKLYPTADEANADLEEAVVWTRSLPDKFLAADWLKKQGANCCKFLGDIPGSETKIAVALRKGDDDLREQFNAAIKKIRDDTYETIRKKYFDFTTSIDVTN